MKRVETIQLKKNNNLSKLCHLCKNLYNLGNYYINMNYEIMEEYLNWYDTKYILKTSKPFKKLPAQVAQNVLKYLHLNWKSYFESLKDWRKDPMKYQRRPQPPRYLKKDGEFVACFNHQHIPQKKQLEVNKEKRYLHFPKKTNLEPIEIVSTFSEIQQVRLVPKYDIYKLEIVYNHIEQQNLGLNKNRVLGIDIGVNNLTCCVNNIGTQPFIVNGRPLKSINQFYNKKVGTLQAQVSKQLTSHCKKTFIGKIYKKNGKLTDKFRDYVNKQAYNYLQQTKKMKKLRRIRNNKIKDYMHKTSRYIINYCIEHEIGTIIVGKNPLWKKEVKMGKKNNQSFVQIPFNILIEQLQYKGDFLGIKVRLVTEEYTSQTCCKCGIIKKTNRKTRGLYECSNCRIKINADVNGAFNILKKAFPKAFEVNGIEGAQLHPLRVNLNTKTRSTV